MLGITQGSTTSEHRRAGHVLVSGYVASTAGALFSGVASLYGLALPVVAGLVVLGAGVVLQLGALGIYAGSRARVKGEVGAARVPRAPSGL